MELTRRNLVKGAAWSIPVISVAVATPLASASGSNQTCKDRMYIYRPKDYEGSGSMGPNNNVAEISVSGNSIVITYTKSVDLIDINVHKPSGNINRHDNSRVHPGHKINIDLVNCEDPTLIQVHGNNTHYYGNGVFA